MITNRAGVLEVLEAGYYGRVLALDPNTGQARTMGAGSFANGNAIEPGGRFLVVADQYRYRIARLWLTGAAAGQVDTFAEILPHRVVPSMLTVSSSVPWPMPAGQGSPPLT